MRENLNVKCPWCDHLNAIPRNLFVEAKTMLVRGSQKKEEFRKHLKELNERVRKKVLHLFEKEEDLNEWIDIRCSNTSSSEYGVHSFRLNVRTDEVRK